MNNEKLTLDEAKDELIEVLKEIMERYTENNKMKDKIIRLLICFLFIEPIIFYTGFVYYKSQFDYVVEETTTTETTTDNSKDIDVSSEGENAEATYIDGNQYNDNSEHKEGGENE